MNDPSIAPREPSRKRPAALTPDEQTRLLETLAQDTSAAGRRNHAIVATLLLSGLTAAELAALDVEDVDFAAGVLHVAGPRARVVPLPPELTDVLRAYLVEGRPALAR